MKEIDWSKAPAGAQGYMPRPTLWAEGWWKECRGKRFFCHYGKDEWNQTYADPFGQHGFVYRPSPDNAAEWAGEGLPPVGAMVEIRLMGWSIRESAEKFIGIPLRVAASFRMDCGTDMIAVDGGHDLGCEVFRAEMAVPARTPEQIAAEEREKAIDTILDDLSLSPECRYIAKRVYESGYRKVTP